MKHNRVHGCLVSLTFNFQILYYKPTKGPKYVLLVLNLAYVIMYQYPIKSQSQKENNNNKYHHG
jgi:hypothetical protein